jgi:hypothetical protein
MSTEPINWEERAKAAESAAAQLQGKITNLSTSLDQARSALETAERRRAIDTALAQAHTIDLDAARLLTEAALAEGKSSDIPKAVADLRKAKPFLFRPAPPQASAMSAAPRPAPTDELARIADQARQTGDKRALLHYLRARRNT